jgi:hypothetical protein
MASKQKYFTKEDAPAATVAAAETPAETPTEAPAEVAPIVGEIKQLDGAHLKFEVTVEDLPPLDAAPEPEPEREREPEPEPEPELGRPASVPLVGSASAPRFTEQTMREMAAGRAVLAQRG